MSHRGKRNISLAGVAIIVICAAPTRSARAEYSHAAMELLPRDLVAFYCGQPGENGAAGGGADWIARGASLAGRIGHFPDRTRLIIDSLASLPLLGKYPHVVALLDVRAMESRPGVYQLASFKAVLILETGGANEEVERRIRELLGVHTNNTTARLEEDDVHGVRVYRLVDARVPAWATVQWAAVGRHYVVGVGDGAVARVLNARNNPAERLFADEWHAWAFRACGGRRQFMNWMIDFRELSARLGGEVGRRTDEVLAALGLGGVERSAWGVSQDGRAVSVVTAGRTGGENRVMSVSDPARAEPATLSAVPPGATNFMVIRADVPSLLTRIARAYVSTQSAVVQERMQVWWERIQRESGVSADDDLLTQLGGVIVIHDDPQHPWGVPFARTILLQVRGDASRVRVAVDALLGKWQTALRGTDAEPERPRFGPQLHRTDDGVWTFQYGVVSLLGIAVADRWVVVSYSPAAAQANVAHLTSHPVE